NPRELSGAAWTRSDRCLASGDRRARPVHILGLSGRRMAKKPRAAYRSSAAVAPGQRPAHRCRNRQLRPRLGEAVRPCSGLDRPRSGALARSSRDTFEQINGYSRRMAERRPRRLRGSQAVDIGIVHRRYRNDPTLLRRWLRNKTPETVASWIERPDNSLLIATERSAVLAVGSV